MVDKRRIQLPAGREVILMDSTGYADASDTGHIIVAGSHGGLAVKYGGEVRIAAIFLNDAGPGKENAGIAAFSVFDSLAIPAVAYSYMSARIGDVEDAWANGVTSFINQHASAMGFVVGESVQAAIYRVYGNSKP